MILSSTRKRFLATLLLVAVLMTIMPRVSFAANGTFGIEMLVDKTEVYSGESFTYTIKYSYSSGKTDATNVVLVDELPDGLEIVDVMDSIDIASSDVTNGKVTFTFKDPLKAGTTGTVKVRAKFKEGVIPANPTVLNTASITGNEVDDPINVIAEQTSNQVSVKAKAPVSDWYVEKAKINPSGEPALNTNVKYKITVHSNSLIGGLDLKDIVITDTYEENADFVSASGGGVADTINRTVTWNINELAAGDQKTYYLTLNYPDSDFSVNAEAGKSKTAVNTVEVTANNYDNTDAGSDTDSVNHDFANPSYSMGNIQKHARPGIGGATDEYSEGQVAQFYIKGIANTSNVPLHNFTITDTIPSEIELTEISTGSFFYSDGVEVAVSYKTVIGVTESDWLPWRSEIDAGSSTSLKTSSLVVPLQPGEKITAVQWSYRTVPAGFSLGEEGIKVYGTVRNGTNGTSITNTAYLDASDGTNPLAQRQASETIAVIDEMPWITATKNTVNGDEFYEEEFAEFELEIANHQYATGQLNSPIIVDELLSAFDHSTLEYLGWRDTTGADHEANSSGSNKPTLNPSYNVNGNTCYKWTFGGTILQPGKSVAVYFKAQVKKDTLAGFVGNNMYATSSNGSFKSDTAVNDDHDYDGDGSTDDKLVKASKQVFVKFKGSLKSEKWVKGELDTKWSYYSNPKEFTHGQTLPGGIADYKLKVSNEGSNGPIANIVVIDVLPYIGDKELVSGNDRESTWRPNLVNQIEFAEGSVEPSAFKIWYSVEPENTDTWQVPDLRQVENPADKSSYNTGWTETLPEDVTRVRALKFDFGDLVLESGEKIELIWPMRAPVGAPKEIIAWNSFMYGATYPDVSEGIAVQEPFLKAEPQKVGFKIFDPDTHPASLGNFIWEDMNKNGIQEDSEPGINGVLVELFEEGETTPLKYTRSGDSYSNIANEGKPGYYLFPYLPTGKKYYVKFTLPTGYEDYLLTTYGQGTEATDSDVDPASVEMATELITLTDNNYDIDLGLYRKASIGDLVWNDRNMDGVQDSGEPGLAGIEVKLYDNTDLTTVLQTKTTNASGHYKFTDLDPGSYLIEFINNGDYVFSTQNTGQVDKDLTNDSDANPVDGKTEVITVVSGENNEDIDAGVYMAELGNLIWHDLDADGIKDSNESGIDGVTVKLFKDSSDTGKTCTTGQGSLPQGEYEFIDLVPGSYHIEVINPGYDAISPLNSMGNDNDNDLNSSGTTSKVSLAAGERYYKLDGGFYKYAQVGDFVWNDLNHDGVKDSDETGIDGVEVNLYEQGSSTIKHSATTSNGSYKFTNLTPGSYYMDIKLDIGVASNYKVSPNNGSLSNSTNSDFNSSGKTIDFTLVSDDDIKHVDCGLHKALIGDRVWEDMDADGLQDDGNTGISGISVRLLDSLSNEVRPAIDTDSHGYYLFTNLDAGDYIVEFTKPVGNYITTAKTVDTDNGSDVNDATQKTDIISIAKGQTNKDIDAGYWQPAKIGDYVWYEVNGDGLQGGTDEVPIKDVVVELYKDGSAYSTPKTTTTDANGFYEFDNLKPGSYQVKFTLPAGYDGFIDKDMGNNGIDSDVDWDGVSATGLTAATSLVSGEVDHKWDAGIYRDVIIGDYVWEDVDADGIQDDGNTGINAVTVELYKKSGSTPVKTTTTADNSSSNPGYYEFTPLPPGEYYLKVVYDEDVYRVSPVDQLSDDSVDSDCARDTKKTADFQIDSTTENLSYDFGLYKKNSIGDKVWLDVNGDSIQNGSDTGVKDVKVYLLDTSNAVLDSMLTDSNGKYLFDNLDAGTYRIGIKKSEITNLNYKDYLITKQNSGSDDDVDSDISQTETTTGYCATGDYVLVSDNNNLSVDIGLYEPASIGNFVWDDLNADGIQDAGEPGINGVVTIKLYDADTNEYLDSTSPTNGIYKFEGLDAGNYYVEFSTSRGVSPPGIGSGPNPDQNDSDIDTITKKTGIIALKNGEQNETVDAGFYIPASIGNIVWHDVNGDGKQGSAASEPRINGVTVMLLDSSDTEVATCITGDGALNDGEYLFENRIPGDYRIKVDLSTAVGFDGFTDQDIGSDDTSDSDVDENGFSPLTDLISDEDDMSWDAGLYKSVAIGDYIWEDIDADGIQENRPFEGIDVTLVRVIDSIYTVVDTMTTGVDGKYLFTDQKPGEFYVEIDKPSNYRITVKDEATTDDENDSDANLNNARTDNFNVESGDTDLSRDIGLYLKNSIGDKVWLDSNGDGLQGGTGENGIKGIKVYLYDGVGDEIAWTETNSNGNYLFDNLYAGTYQVGVKESDLTDLGYTLTERDVDGNGQDSLDSDIDKTTFKTVASYTLKSNDNIDSVDIGLYKLATVGNFVWEDMNCNGVQDEVGTGIKGVKVELYDLTNKLVDDTDTDPNGLYQFTGIAPGDYYVKFTAPSQYVTTRQNIDPDNTDSDINSAGKTSTITLKSGDIDESIDAGYYIPVTIGDKIWQDNDADGIQNDGDSGINGVLVELYEGTSKVDSFTTGFLTKGEYKFTGLAPGSYYVKVTKPDSEYIFSEKGSGTSTDSDVDVNTGESSPKTYVSGDIDLDIDVGMYKLVSIGDKVWLDDDADGLQDGGESGINDVTVKLYVDNVYKDSVTTVGAGDYEFTDLMPGNYSIEVIKDSNYYFTTQDNGDDSLDSDINPATSKSVTKFVPSSSVIETWDGGLYLENSIGDKVWLDKNGNGMQDDHEPGINGVTVKLYKSGITDPIATYETGSGSLAKGEYLFENLEAGAYIIGVDKPTGYHLTDENNGDDAKDSDVDQSTEKTSEYILQSDDHIKHVDIGLYKLTTIGDYAWNDLDADGKQETGEPGIAGIDVTLHKTNGSQVGSKITTGSDGLYQFSGIAPGDYYVKFRLPIDSKFVATAHNAASDDGLDSDISALDTYNFKTHTISINTNEIDGTLDAGFYIPAKLGDFIWEDVNGNGIQDEVGTGIKDVVIELINDVTAERTQTAAATDGYYSFNKLVPGNYHVEVTLPTEYGGFIAKNKGSDNTKDSDVDVNGVSASVNLISGSNNQDLDVGIYKHTSIGNYVWEDLNADGIQDSDETFIKDTNGDEVEVEVRLYKTDESPEIEFNTTTTNGYYSFADLVPGKYRVEFELLANYHLSAQNAVGNTELDSNPDNMGVVPGILLKSGEPDNTIDCGMYKSNSISNKVWHDKNGNGIQDDLESGIAGIEVRLFDSAGNYLGENDITNANGEYLIDNLEQGSYRIGIADRKEYTITTQNVNSNTSDSEDSDIAIDTMLSDDNKLYVLTSNTHNDTADIGLYILGSIGDYVWEDTNGNGEQGEPADEPPLTNVTVTLKYPDGSVVEDKTDGDGKYEFTKLPPGTYELKFSKPTNYHFTTQNTVTNSKDSDVNAKGIVIYTLESDEDNMNLDAGLVRYGAIGDYVWRDSNRNGIQDLNERGLDKQRVKLIYFDGATEETETNIVGYYEFTDLHPGDFQVQFYPKGDYVLTRDKEGVDDKDSDPDRSTGITAKFALDSGAIIDYIDAGMYEVPDQVLPVGKGSIGDYVWIDKNKNGIQDYNEKGIGGVKVILIPKKAERIETTTDSNGKYLFDKLPDGLYSLRVEEPVGYKATTRNSGSDRDKDSDANINGFIEVISLRNNAKIRNIDIGLVGIAELGDFVWYDLNNNGAQDSGEPGVENVIVYLLDKHKTPIMQTKTDNNGKYLFTELVPGSYFVKIAVPEKYGPTIKHNAPEYRDSDSNASGITDEIALNPGQKRFDVDFGLKKEIPKGEIGNYIWADCSDDGVQDSFENGVPDITVKLLDQNKAVIDTTITDTQGHYLFSNVYEGEYYIDIVLPDGIRTAKRYAASENNDSNANAGGLTGKITLAQKQKNMSIDIGLVKYGDITGVITDDDTGEPLINSEVVVKNRKGRVIDIVTTDDKGNYVIKNISQCMEISLIPKKDNIENPDQEEPGDEPPINGEVEVPDDNTVTEGQEPSNGEVTIDGDGNWKYTPDAGFTGKDTFSIIITDGDGNEEEIYIEIDVEGVPLGTIKELPETGASRNTGLYILGFLCILVGIILKKRQA